MIVNYMIIDKYMEAEPGIEPRSTALQAAAIPYISITYGLITQLAHPMS